MCKNNIVIVFSVTNWLVASHRNRAFEILASNKNLFVFNRLGMRSVLPQQKHIHQTESKVICANITGLINKSSKLHEFESDSSVCITSFSKLAQEVIQQLFF